jgi:hypothetical protein
VEAASGIVSAEISAWMGFATADERSFVSMGTNDGKTSEVVLAATSLVPSSSAEGA